MDPFWIVLFVLFCIYKVYSWDKHNKRIREYEKERAELKSYTERAEEENPELVGMYWNPKRVPVPKELRPRIFARTGGKCFYCDCDLTKLSLWQVDHIWPYRFGGSEELVNLVPSCEQCNVEKWSHLPPRYFMHKWVLGNPFTSHELKLLAYYRNVSMANLIGTSAHWKGRADYWNATIFSNFVDLITQNECIKLATGTRRRELISEADRIFKKLDCDIASRNYSYRSIKSWIEWEESWSRHKGQEVD